MMISPGVTVQAQATNYSITGAAFRIFVSGTLNNNGGILLADGQTAIGSTAGKGFGNATNIGTAGAGATGGTGNTGVGSAGAGGLTTMFGGAGGHGATGVSAGGAAGTLTAPARATIPRSSVLAISGTGIYSANFESLYCGGASGGGGGGDGDERRRWW